MHVLLSNNKMLNLYITEDVQQGFHDKKIVVIYLTNGTKLIENFKTEAEAEQEVERIRSAMQQGSGGSQQVDSFKDLPETGNPGTIYIVKDSGQTYYYDEVTKTYIAIGQSGRTGIYSYDGSLPAKIGDSIDIDKSDLEEILKPSSDYKEGSTVIGLNSIQGVITKINDTTVTVKSITNSTLESFRELENESELPEVGQRNTLYYIKDTNEFKIWDSDTSKYIDPINTIILKDTDVKDAKLNTLYVANNSIKYTSNNLTWNYLASEAQPYEQGKNYYKGILVYHNNTLVKTLKDGPSNSTAPNITAAFTSDIDSDKFEVIVDGSINSNVIYDITGQLDGTKQTFVISKTITPDKSLLVFYAGQLLLKDVNYTVDYDKHTLTTLFPEPPDSLEDKHLVLITGDVSTPSVVRKVEGEDVYLVDNTDPANPIIKHDNTKIDKSTTNLVENFLQGKTEVLQDGNNVNIKTTSINTNTGKAREDNITLKSKDGNVKLEVEDVGKYQKNIVISTIGNTVVYENAIKFNGIDNRFTLPNDINLDRPILVIVNGIVQSINNDYIIDGNQIEFVLTFESDSNNIIINFK